MASNFTYSDANNKLKRIKTFKIFYYFKTKTAYFLN